MKETDPTKRFSNRVENYVKYRPGYPLQLLGFLKQYCDLTSSTLIADIGSGTGILSELFLKNGNFVIGVEPNNQMRQTAEKLLSKYPNFNSVNGTAEFTTLESKSVDLVIAGQAFHWFDAGKARIEFQRILKSAGYVALIWNERKYQEAPFMIAFESFLGDFGISYPEVKQVNSYDDMDEFFGRRVEMRTYDNLQSFDFHGLKGRFLSSSYAPTPDSPNYDTMLEKLRQLFDEFQQNGRVPFEYNTRIFCGQIK